MHTKRWQKTRKQRYKYQNLDRYEITQNKKHRLRNQQTEQTTAINVKSDEMQQLRCSRTRHISTAICQAKLKRNMNKSLWILAGRRPMMSRAGKQNQKPKIRKTLIPKYCVKLKPSLLQEIHIKHLKYLNYNCDRPAKQENKELVSENVTELKCNKNAFWFSLAIVKWHKQNVKG